MEEILSKVTQQAMNYAIRSGIAITSGYAINQCTRLLKTVEGHDRDELRSLQRRLESKIRIISPAIDMIELIAARGNTSLDSAVILTKSIRIEIQRLGMRLAKVVNVEEVAKRRSTGIKSRAQADMEVKLVISDIKMLLNQIEDAVPLINLAITTSGVNLSTSMPSTVSPSRLLQASMFLTTGDSAYTSNPLKYVQIGPVFVLSLYMLFSGHAHRAQGAKDLRETTWKEVIHKARVKLLRVPLDRLYSFPDSQGQKPPMDTKEEHADSEFPSNVPSEGGAACEFAYQLQIIEDLDDDRVHTFEENEAQPGPVDDVAMAGIREVMPIHEVSKIFYADTGKILNIGAEAEINNPVLLLKRDPYAIPPRRMMQSSALDYDDDLPDTNEYDGKLSTPGTHTEHEFTSGTSANVESWRLPPNLDPEWMAFEVYTEQPDDEDDEDADDTPTNDPTPSKQPTPQASVGPIAAALAGLRLGTSSPNATQELDNNGLGNDIDPDPPTTSSSRGSLPPLRTSLSLLELLIRLTALQQFQQSSHLAISDELLNFFLSESSSTGAGADSERRKAMRSSARRQVGFDPYSESPMKFRGEQYLVDHEQQGQEWQEDEPVYDDLMFRGSSPAPRSPSDARRLRSSASPFYRTQSSPGPGDVFPNQTGPSSPQTPGTKSRADVLRRDGGVSKRSSLGRTESESTLGTSPKAGQT
jgi:hypothetical protein